MGPAKATISRSNARQLAITSSSSLSSSHSSSSSSSSQSNEEGRLTEVNTNTQPITTSGANSRLDTGSSISSSRLCTAETSRKARTRSDVSKAYLSFVYSGQRVPLYPL